MTEKELSLFVSILSMCTMRKYEEIVEYSVSKKKMTVLIFMFIGD
jgi:hypothetical protein